MDSSSRSVCVRILQIHCFLFYEYMLLPSTEVSLYFHAWMVVTQQKLTIPIVSDNLISMSGISNTNNSQSVLSTEATLRLPTHSRLSPSAYRF